MKSFLKFIVLVLLGFIALNYVYYVIVHLVDWDAIKVVEAHSFSQQDIGTIVLGNSTAMDGINPAYLSGGDTYNISLGGSNLMDHYTQLVTYLKNNNPPEKLIICLSSCHVNYQVYAPLHPLIDEHYKNTPWSLKELPLYKFQWLFAENLKKLISSKHRNAKLVKGQLQITKSIPDRSKKNTLSKINKLDQTYYAKPAFNPLWDMQQLASEKGIRFIVVELPCGNSQRSLAPVGITEISRPQTEQSFELLNLNNQALADSIINAEQHWLSKNHLNVEGSIALTKYLSFRID